MGIIINNKLFSGLLMTVQQRLRPDELSTQTRENDQFRHFLHAVDRGDFVKVCTLLLPSFVNKEGMSRKGKPIFSLILAAKRGHLELCELLLENNAIVDIADEVIFCIT